MATRKVFTDAQKRAIADAKQQLLLRGVRESIIDRCIAILEGRVEPTDEDVYAAYPTLLRASQAGGFFGGDSRGLPSRH